MERTSLLIFRLGGLGDLLVTLPALNLLRESLAPCSITLVGRQDYGQLLKMTGVVDNIINAEEAWLAPLFSPGAVSEQTEQWLSGYSVILGYMQRERLGGVEDICRSLQKVCRIFVYDPAAGEPVSRFFYFLTRRFLDENYAIQSRAVGRLDTAGHFSLGDPVRLSLSTTQKREGLSLVEGSSAGPRRRLAVVHPGSGSAAKCWSLKNFMEIVRRLSRQGIGGALVTGYAEERMVEVLREITFPSGWTWLHDPPLLKLSGLLASCAVYIGNDSGVTHMAAVCGANVVALYRSENLPAWQPIGRPVICSAEEVSAIKLSQVWEAMRNLLDQSNEAPKSSD